MIHAKADFRFSKNNEITFYVSKEYNVLKRENMTL